jgi:hypothetical protein
LVFLLFLSVNSVAAQSGAEAPIPYQPELLFDLSDEVMSLPLGVVTDVAVGADGIVYLLDRQNCNIRRITLAGDIKSPLGRRGEGPGEMSLPHYLALFPDGRCLVIQDMSGRAVCLMPDGDACDMGDISIFRAGYNNTIVTRTEADPNQRLILSAITMERHTRPGASLEERGTCISVRRAHTVDGRLETLFTTDANTPSRNAIFFPLIWSGYADYGWDINNAGTIIFFDPKGSYSVNIGHPADGKTQSISLLPWEYDEERIKKLAREADNSVKANGMPRITNIQWLENEFFMVIPTAEIQLTPIAGVITTVEVFRRDGCSFGRYIIQGDFDFDNDGLYIRGDIVVIIKGGKSSARAAFSAVLPSDKTIEGNKPEEVDEIRVLAYRLFKSLRESD